MRGKKAKVLRKKYLRQGSHLMTVFHNKEVKVSKDKTGIVTRTQAKWEGGRREYQAAKQTRGA
ncbi:MAG: hypothetical protein KKB59_18980 [Spirochaetes bacterium]|nr:hypothetical protein [Spirochaetota bacterium]